MMNGSLVDEAHTPAKLPPGGGSGSLGTTHRVVSASTTVHGLDPWVTQARPASSVGTVSPPAAFATADVT